MFFKVEGEQMTKTCTIEAFAVPQPVQEPLEYGQEYYVANFHVPNGIANPIWLGDESDYRWLAAGRIHLNREDAFEHGYAVYMAFNITVKNQEEKANER